MHPAVLPTPQKTKKLKKPPKQKKMRTYCRRKAEIKELMVEMARLKEQKEMYMKRVELMKEREELLRREEPNQTLRKVLHAQHLAFASSLSMVSQVLLMCSFDSAREANGAFCHADTFTERPLCRHIALLRMKHERIQRAYDFMRERQRFMDITTEYCDQKKFQATNGDLCSEIFDVVPLPGARSVKAIVDALEYFVYNIEISMSEVLGDITIRENDDPHQSSSVAQHRLVTTIGDVVQMDTNNVAFNEYIPAGPGQSEIGFSISDTVDEDDAFPYKPSRIRQDVTVITMGSWNRLPDNTPIIVLARWWCLRIRQNTMNVPHYAVTRIQNGIERVGAAIMTAARNADTPQQLN